MNLTIEEFLSLAQDKELFPIIDKVFSKKG
jgi:hypothetical protein